MIEKPIERMWKDRNHLEVEIEKVRRYIENYREKIEFMKERIELMKVRLQEYDEAIYFLEKLEESKGVKSDE